MSFVYLIITVQRLHCMLPNRKTKLYNLLSNTTFEGPWKQDPVGLNTETQQLHIYSTVNWGDFDQQGDFVYCGVTLFSFD